MKIKEINELLDIIAHGLDDNIPATVFSTELSPCESLVKYLKEQKQHRYSEIARILNRDQRTIWCIYNRVKNKPLNIAQTSHLIPIAIFSQRKLSILEHIVSHLKKQNLKTKQISQILNKKPSTIATIEFRVRRKQ